DHYYKSAHPQPEAEPLDPGVALHAQGDHAADEREDDQAADEDAIWTGEERGHPRPAKGIREWREELQDQNVGVDRGPEPEREPPPGDGEHEANAAAKDAALPGIITAGPRHYADQLRIGNHQERHEHTGKQDRAEQLPVRNGIDERHAVE